ncbi:MAG TPA: hypothetical protein VM867_08485 [Xanthobacteraceae bacterium]|nr:hypothetical protein [Xanthobacteraceae bacterium]
MRTILLVTAAVLTSTAAHAGSNACEGIVTIGPEWTIVESEHKPADGYYATGCKFRTQTKLGKRVLKECPQGSLCTLDLPLDGPGKDMKDGIVTKIDWVTRRR